VAFDKLGDAVGAGVIRLVLFISVASLISNRLITSLAVVLGALCFVLTLRLGRGYVSTLEKSLLNQAADLDLIDIEEKTTRKTLLGTLGTVDLGVIQSLSTVVPEQFSPRATERPETDSLIRRMRDLQSEHPDDIRLALTSEGALDPFLVAPAIQLLA